MLNRILRIGSDPSAQPDEPDVEQTRREQEIMQTQSVNVLPIGSFSSTNSNIGTSSMSGSLRHFRRTQPASINESRSNDGDDGNNDSFHECSESVQNIYSPISMSQPASQPAIEHHDQQYFFANEIAGTSNQRIAVAALPNLDFDHGATIGGRPFSTSSPSVYAIQQQSNNENGGGSNDANNEQRRNFIRNTTAASSNYFV